MPFFVSEWGGAGQNSAKAGASRCEARGRRGAPTQSGEMKDYVGHPEWGFLRFVACASGAEDSHSAARLD